MYMRWTEVEFFVGYEMHEIDKIWKNYSTKINDPVPYTDRMEMKCVLRGEHTKDSHYNPPIRPIHTCFLQYNNTHTYKHAHAHQTHSQPKERRNKIKEKIEKANTQEVIKNAKKCTFIQMYTYSILSSSYGATLT